MILPGSYTLTLILLILGLICWGSWASSLKFAGPKWRFELFYFDFAAGLLIVALVAALSLGSFGMDGFTVMDDINLAGKRQDAMAFLAGALFNLGNILMIGAVSIGGITIAVPVSFGVALIVGTLMSHFFRYEGNILLLLAGCAAVLGAVIFDSMAWKRFNAMKLAEAREAAATLAAQQSTEGKTAPAAKTGKSKKPRRKSARGKVLFLASLGGFFLGSFSPFISMAKEAENGIGPYTIALIFAIGVVFTTFVFNLFFMNLPLQGAAIEFRDYFSGNAKQHLAGMAGGVVFGIGAVANFVAASAEGPAVVGAPLRALITDCLPIVSAVWGLAVWKEFDGAESSIRILLGVMLFLFVAGAAAMALGFSFPGR
jgi:glucose uptake protein